jgi:hypothetical protein
MIYKRAPLTGGFLFKKMWSVARVDFIGCNKYGPNNKSQNYITFALFYEVMNIFWNP